MNPRRLWLLAAAALLSACAGGDRFKDVSPRIPSLPLVQSRVYFYRGVASGAAVQPTVRLNDQPIGVAKAGSFFFVDRDPGRCEVGVGEAADDKLQMTLAAGQTRYVRFDLKAGLLADHLVPVAIDEIDAGWEILPLHYIGPPLPKPKRPSPQ